MQGWQTTPRPSVGNATLICSRFDSTSAAGKSTRRKQESRQATPAEATAAAEAEENAQEGNLKKRAHRQSKKGSQKNKQERKKQKKFCSHSIGRKRADRLAECARSPETHDSPLLPFWLPLRLGQLLLKKQTGRVATVQVAQRLLYSECFPAGRNAGFSSRHSQRGPSATPRPTPSAWPPLWLPPPIAISSRLVPPSSLSSLPHHPSHPHPPSFPALTQTHPRNCFLLVSTFQEVLFPSVSIL